MPLAPVALRLDPGTGPRVVARFRVHVAAEIGVTLEQSETAHVVSAEVVHGQGGRVVQRTPQPFITGAVMDQQPIAVMHLWSPFTVRAQRVLRSEERRVGKELRS